MIEPRDAASALGMAIFLAAGLVLVSVIIFAIFVIIELLA